MNSKLNPQIYVASLSDYNAGSLLGDWISVDGLSVDELFAKIQEILAQSTEEVAEEWAIHDYEDFHCYLSEWEDLATIPFLSL